jgi:hypothetical protein
MKETMTVFEELSKTTKEWHTRVVTLSETKGLSERFFTEFILSRGEGVSK